MTERFEVPCGAMWSLAAERATHVGYSQAAGASKPADRSRAIVRGRSCHGGNATAVTWAKQHCKSQSNHILTKLLILLEFI